MTLIDRVSISSCNVRDILVGMLSVTGKDKFCAFYAIQKNVK